MAHAAYLIDNSGILCRAAAEIGDFAELPHGRVALIVDSDAKRIAMDGPAETVAIHARRASMAIDAGNHAYASALLGYEAPGRSSSIRLLVAGRDRINPAFVALLNRILDAGDAEGAMKLFAQKAA